MKTHLLIFVFLLLIFFQDNLWAQGVLVWPEKQKAIEYQGEISTTKDFKSIILNFKSPTNTFELPPGNWGKEIYFRIRYLDEWKRISPYSNVARVRFEIIAPVVTPVREEIELSIKSPNFYFLSLIPSQTFSLINSESAKTIIPYPLSAGGQKVFSDYIHYMGLNFFPFQNDINGELITLDYKYAKNSQNLFWGPSIEILYFDVIYKDKAEILGADFTLGGQIGWTNSAEDHPWVIRAEALGSYDLKGYLVKAEISKSFYRHPKYSLSTGLKARHFDYKTGPHYIFSSLGWHLTLERP